MDSNWPYLCAKDSSSHNKGKHQNSLAEDFFVKLFLQFDILGFYKGIEPTRDFYGTSTFFPSNQRSVNKYVDFTEKF